MMIEIGNQLVSEDVKDKQFVCNLTKCKGACCIEGDLGAPLQDDERQKLEKIYDDVKPFLTKEGVKAIEQQGTWVLDDMNEYSTPTVAGKECAYVYYDNDQVLKCGIEQAYNEGKIDYKKPISCHLYPIRITKYAQFEAINYDKWDICNDACTLGEELGVPVYQFLKEPLVRKYGEQWYKELEKKIKV